MVEESAGEAIEIYTTGYPRSGSTWLWQTLSDLFCAPLQNIPGEPPIVTEFAKEIKPGYIIRKTHWYRRQYSPASLASNHRMILIFRDPRDMVVSQMFYRNSTDLEKHVVLLGRLGYHEYVKDWYAHPPDFVMTYEGMHNNALFLLGDLYQTITGMAASGSHVADVISRQRFNQQPVTHAHRKGIIGDWKNHFTRNLAELFEKKHGSLLRLLGYETDGDWWKEIPNE